MRSSKGFTLIEVMMALVILAIVILGLSASTTQFLHVVALGQRRVAAIQLAEARVERIQMDPAYATIDSLYKGTETSFPGVTGYTRVTDVVRVGGPTDSIDMKRITVRVWAAGLPDTISRSIVMAAP